jgi:hypothetical protein
MTRNEMRRRKEDKEERKTGNLRTVKGGRLSSSALCSSIPFAAQKLVASTWSLHHTQQERA